MEVRFVTPDGMTAHPVEAVASLRARTDGLVWVDASATEDGVAELLRDGFGAHPLVIEACLRRNHVPTVHGYGDAFFLVQHTPLLGPAGHVHLLELDQLIGPDFLVTVHGPINPVVDPAQAMTETELAARRIDDGRLHATSPMRLAYAIGSAGARRQRALVGDVAEKLPGLEQEVMTSRLRDPEQLLEQLFLIRHELTTARTMAAQCHDVVARLHHLGRGLADSDRELVDDLADQLDRVRSLADGESQFLFGVIDLYQTKVNTKMTVAMERLAVIAAVTLPITAIASIYGMNILGPHQHLELALVLLVMLLMSAQLLRWARRQGWW
ncbi:magnesium transporter CorA family protein [Nocardioides terrisoli]|uniref:magnesium transporter CorA family protein n=1 Tax=Nocardioides terrisoli TaxID=3388267 RepID=UPI00287BC43B|nr:magnesium transporter CorA family protein [Nocardioides marmorisolisilvae]